MSPSSGEQGAVEDPLRIASRDNKLDQARVSDCAANGQSGASTSDIDQPNGAGSPAVKTPEREKQLSGPGGSGLSTASLGPRDSFTDQFLASAARLKDTVLKTEAVSFKDVAANPSLGRRARAEMNSHQLKGALEGNLTSPMNRKPHDMEVARLQVSLDAVEMDVDEESKSCSQLARAVVHRLDASRRAVERLLGILQAVSAAEAAYTRAMSAVSRVTLSSEIDGSLLKTALLRFSDIPFSLAQNHSAIASGMGEVTKGCQEAVRDMRRECEAIASDSRHAQANVHTARKSLHAAFASHRAACSAADSVVLQQQKLHKSTAGRIEVDPWLSEAKVVAVQAGLLTAQKGLRTALEGACGRVLHYEEHRIEMLKDIVHSFLHSYRSQLGAGQKSEESMLKVLDDLNCQTDLEDFTTSVRSCQDICRELSERQNQALETTSQDLLCSPDIIRQGQMARWITGSGKWAECHFVLTRSGFLHWLADAESYTPLGSLNLSKCQFETGEAPKFHIIELPSGYTGFFGKNKKMMFEAPSVDECCEWAIAIREAIASHKA